MHRLAQQDRHLFATSALVSCVQCAISYYGDLVLLGLFQQTCKRPAAAAAADQHCCTVLSLNAPRSQANAVHHYPLGAAQTAVASRSLEAMAQCLLWQVSRAAYV
jgi:hypothetical protein